MPISHDCEREFCNDMISHSIKNLNFDIMGKLGFFLKESKLDYEMQNISIEVDSKLISEITKSIIYRVDTEFEIENVDFRKSEKIIYLALVNIGGEV